MDKKLIPGTNRITIKITGATVYVYQEGFGWDKINELGGSYLPEVTHTERIISFSKRFTLEVSTNPVLKAIPLLGEVDGGNIWLAEVKGVYDVISGVGKAEFGWP